MCGIYAYAGPQNATTLIVQGLKRLEYRGYDSWGVAVIHKDSIKISKKVGPVGDLKKVQNLPYANIGIGHTRWATHGGVTQFNAHPHCSTDKSFVVAQNGIVENYQQLKQVLLKKGYRFITQTDTEIIVRLIEEKLKHFTSLKEATRQAFLELKGRNTIVVLSQKNQQIIAIRYGSPLVAGLGKKELFLASDALSFANQTNKVIFINDWEMVIYQKEELQLFDLKTNQKIKNKIATLDHQTIRISKQNFDSFYLKEIFEQTTTLKTAALYSYQELKPLIQAVRQAGRIFTLGAGTASYAAGQGAYWLRELSKIPAYDLKAYEINSWQNVFKKNDVLIACSQSGETADTLEAIKLAKNKGVRIASIVNMIGSTLTRESDFPFFLRSGPEISVVSTKAFTAKLSWFLLLAYALKNKIAQGKKIINKTAQEVSVFTTKNYQKRVRALAKKLVNNQHLFVLGQDALYYISLEGALKIKEVSYLHAEGFSSGELKHGVIALIEKRTPVIGLVSKNQSNTLNALAEVKTRGAWIIGVSQENNELYQDWLPLPNLSISTPIVSIIPLQLLGYCLAREKDLNPDKPRNLAKSVTVK